MKHQISIHGDRPHVSTPALRGLIARCIRRSLDIEGVTAACEVNVLLTDNAGIRELNRDYRDVDRETDVLSFPMFELEPGAFPADVSEMIDPGTGLVPLGDMAISVEKARAQAEEYGHSPEREVGYLTIHSVLHLLGYDHVDEGEMKRQMRSREDVILRDLGLWREEK